MTASAPTAEEQIAFLGQIERLLSEGQFVASYKYALLVALANLAVRHGTDDGRTLDISVSALGESFIELYWRHAVPYGSGISDGDGSILVQNTGRQAAILSVVNELRRPCGTLSVARASSHWATALREATRLVEDLPLWKLQRLRGETLQFLYSASPVPDHIRLGPGVAANLRRFHGLVVRLAQSEWLRFIQSLPANASILGPTSDLEGFLFGSERTSLLKMVDPLLEVQHGHCFYCGGDLRVGEVDHFIPWSRYPRDLAHNFVLAHGSCNRKKSNTLAALPHLERWMQRNADYDDAVRNAGVNAGMVVDGPGTVRVAAWAYGHAASLQAETWLESDRVEPLSDGWRLILGHPQNESPLPYSA
jgi:hypothetical protein